MASEQFSLCWDNFHKNMSSGMNSLLENEDLVDVTLAVEGKYLKAHKMVLSVCSPYFKELFKTNPCQHPIVFMKDVSYVAISDLLQFMYQGEVQVSQENLTTFIKTAEALQIKGLTGDGNGSTDADVEPVPEKPTTHRAPEEYKPAARAKRQPAAPVTTPTPTVKRARLSASSSDSQPLPPVLTKAEPISSTPSTSEAVQFKMEPYDNSQSIDLADEGDDNFGDDTLDDNTVDDNEDYSMMEGTEGEPQAGTSADGAGEGQGTIYFEGTYGGSFKLIYEGYEYFKALKYKDKIYWRCAKFNTIRCLACVILRGENTLIIKNSQHKHNDPKNENSYYDKLPYQLVSLKYGFGNKIGKILPKRVPRKAKTKAIILIKGTSRSGLKIIYENYQYRKVRKYKPSTYSLKCIYHVKFSCEASITLNGDLLKITNAVHNHETDELIDCSKFSQKEVVVEDHTGHHTASKVRTQKRERLAKIRERKDEGKTDPDKKMIFFEQNHQGDKVLIFEEHPFEQVSDQTNPSIWQCGSKENSCKANIKYFNDHIEVSNSKHNHVLLEKNKFTKLDSVRVVNVIHINGNDNTNQHCNQEENNETLKELSQEEPSETIVIEDDREIGSFSKEEGPMNLNKKTVEKCINEVVGKENIDEFEKVSRKTAAMKLSDKVGAKCNEDAVSKEIGDQSGLDSNVLGTNTDLKLDEEEPSPQFLYFAREVRKEDKFKKLLAVKLKRLDLSAYGIS